MENIFNNLSKLVGNTPLVEITYKYNGQIKTVLAKLEWFNFSGSIKDRPALAILKHAYKTGELKHGQTICETTSGNMGISLAMFARALNNPIIICMPSKMSVERKKLLHALGAKLKLTKTFDEAFLVAEKYGAHGAFLPSQFSNKINTQAHYASTGVEILKKVKSVPAFVAGVGTGGTLMGVGAKLKKACGAKVIAVDPAEANLLKVGHAEGEHNIEGLSDGRIPALYNKKLVDKIISVHSLDAIAMAQKLSSVLGLPVGISSGANFLGCVLSEINNATTVFADDNKKYLSTLLAKPAQSLLVDNIELMDYKVL